MKTLIGINILTSVSAGPYCSHLTFALQTGKTFPNDKFMIFTPPRMSIDRMRNEAARIVLENEFDYLMFIDDDIVIEPHILERMLSHDADIVAAETYIRGYPFNAMFFKRTESGGLDFFNDFKDHIREDGLVPVEAVGFSCVLIKASLLKRVTTPYFITSPNATEDVYFCLKAINELGRENVSIFVDTQVKVGHQLSPNFVYSDNVELLRKFEEAQTKAVLNPDRGEDYKNSIEELFK